MTPPGVTVAGDGNRCPAVIEFAGMVLQCQRVKAHRVGMHSCQWHSADGRHFVEWNDRLSVPVGLDGVSFGELAE